MFILEFQNKIHLTESTVGKESVSFKNIFLVCNHLSTGHLTEKQQFALEFESNASFRSSCKTCMLLPAAEFAFRTNDLPAGGPAVSQVWGEHKGLLSSLKIALCVKGPAWEPGPV